jgi:hypothetical protein
VLTAGDAASQTFMAGLLEVGVPFTTVDLRDPARPAIDAAFLSDAPVEAAGRAKYQAIVAPDETVSGLTPGERAALADYQREFGVRRLSGQVYPSSAVHLHAPDEPSAPSYVGSLDGSVAHVTELGRRVGFGYLRGPIPFDDASPEVVESHGYLSTPLPAAPSRSGTLSVLIDMPVPGTDARGVIAAVLDDSGREELIVTCALNPQQLQQQLMFRGLLRWLTRGVHLGSERHHLDVHVDDVFLANARWVPAHDCTLGADCPADVQAPDILMTAADVDHLLAWQEQSGFALVLAFNGGGHELALERFGAFALGERLIERAAELRWLNHTYTHEYLGCLQDPSLRPLRCARDSAGATSWVPYALAADQIGANLVFARRYGLALDPSELVTGEHSGLRRPPDDHEDNPNLLRALETHAIAWVASDSSREPASRAVGPARTLPRHPLNLFFNVATRAEQVDEYNWLYTSAADGGSGACGSSCIAPLDPRSGFDGYIVPREARAALMRALSNDPRPHYVHQSNLAEDRLLYPLLARVLDDYRDSFDSSAPLVQSSMREAGEELQRMAAWPGAQSRLSAYVESGVLTLSVAAGDAGGPVAVPMTLPTDAHSAGTPLFASYAGEQTGWRSVEPGAHLVIELPSPGGFAE